MQSSHHHGAGHDHQEMQPLDMLPGQRLKSTGLAIDDSIYMPYGGGYSRQDSANFYAGCLKCSGYIPKVICLPCACCECGPLVQVPQGSVGFRLEFGKLIEKLGPGLHTYNPCSEKVVIVDLRVQIFNPPEQFLLTKDNVTVGLDICINYKIVIPEKAAYTSKNYFQFMTQAVPSVMRSVVAEMTLSQLITNRKEVDKLTAEIMDSKIQPFGIDVISIETQSMRMTPKLERAMATVAESEKEAEAKVVTAKGNLESAKLFREAADHLSGNKMSVELKYFHLMKDVAAEAPSLMILPNSIMSQVKAKMAKQS